MKIEVFFVEDSYSCLMIFRLYGVTTQNIAMWISTLAFGRRINVQKYLSVSFTPTDFHVDGIACFKCAYFLTKVIH
jgi:hypothetical protein